MERIEYMRMATWERYLLYVRAVATVVMIVTVPWT
jgi:hypothetical protein